MAGSGKGQSSAIAGARLDRGGVPVYLQIEATLRKEILGGQYPVGSQLPTEEEIVRRFSVSRQTVRAAIHALVVDGLVERYPGRGSFIKDPKEVDTHWVARSLDDILERTFVGDLRILSTGLVDATSEPAAAINLQVEGEEQLFRVESLRVQHGRPLAYTTLFVPAKLIGPVPDDIEEQLQQMRMLLIAEKRSGLRAEKLRQIIGACLSNDKISELLEIERGSVMIQLKHLYLGADSRPIQTSVIHCSPDRHRYAIEFSRER